MRYRSLREEFVQPLQVSQKGISQALNMAQSNVSRALKELEKNGVLETKNSHFKGQKRKMKAYRLSSSGCEQGKKIIDFIERESVLVIIADAQKRMKILNVFREARKINPNVSYFHLIDILTNKNSTIDLTQLPDLLDDRGATCSSEESRKKHHLSDLVNTGEFIGRKSAIKKIISFLIKGGFRCFRVYGMAGMGKSALASEIIRSMKSSHNIFYARFRKWYGLESLRKELIEFLDRSESDKLSETLRRSESLKKILIVLDDLHNAPDGLEEMLKEILTVSSSCGHIVFLLLSRGKTKKMDYSTLKLGERVNKIVLNPLTQIECCQLASLRIFGRADKLDEKMGNMILKATGGIPLQVELLRKEEVLTGNIAARKEGSLGREVLAGLEKDTTKLLKTLSLCTVPVEEDIIPNGTELMEKLNSILLVDRTEGGLYIVHDHIAEIITKEIGYRERKELLNYLGEYLQEIFQREKEGDYLPKSIIEDLDIYFLEYMHHLISLGSAEKALIALSETDLWLTRGPHSQVLKEFLSRIRKKIGESHPSIEVYMSEISYQEKDIRRSKKHLKRAERLLKENKWDYWGKGKLGSISKKSVYQALKEMQRKVRQHDIMNAKVIELEKGLYTSNDSFEKARVCTEIAKQVSLQDHNEASKWFKKAENEIEKCISSNEDGGFARAGRIYLGLIKTYIDCGLPEKAEKLAKKALNQSGRRDDHLTALFNRLIAESLYSKGEYLKAKKLFAKARGLLETYQMPHVISDIIYNEVKCELAHLGILNRVFRTSFLKQSDPVDLNEIPLDKLIIKIDSGLAIIKKQENKAGRLSKFVGKDILDPRMINLKRELLLLKCGMNWFKNDIQESLGCTYELIELGNSADNMDILSEGHIIQARLLKLMDKGKEAKEKLVAFQDENPLLSKGALKAIQRTIELL